MNLEEARRIKNELLLATRIQEAVIDEIMDRKGFDAVWDELDDDIQDELEAAVFTTIVDTIRREAKT